MFAFVRRKNCHPHRRHFDTCARSQASSAPRSLCCINGVIFCLFALPPSPIDITTHGVLQNENRVPLCLSCSAEQELVILGPLAVDISALVFFDSNEAEASEATECAAGWHASRRMLKEGRNPEMQRRKKKIKKKRKKKKIHIQKNIAPNLQQHQFPYIPSLAPCRRLNHH